MKLFSFVLSLGLIGIVLIGCGPTLKERMEQLFSKAPLDSQLAYAAYKGDKKKVEELLQAGADINCKGYLGWTPLQVCVARKNRKGTLLLLEKGANPNLQDESGHSPIGDAAYCKDNPWFLETVIKYGGDVNLKNIKGNETPLFRAIFSLENTKILVKAGADVNAQDSVGQTVMMVAAGMNQFRVVYYLLQAGADPTIKMSDGMSVLYCIQDNHLSSEFKEMLADREKVIQWLKDHNQWHIEEPVWQPGYQKKKATSDK